MQLKKILIWALRFFLLTSLYFPIWILGSLALGNLIPDNPSEPGLVGGLPGMIFLGAINTILIIGLIVSSRWHGWRLAVVLALAYYGANTLLTQMETWYFLSHITVSSQLLPRLFIMGLAVPLIFIPLAILICNQWKGTKEASLNKTVEIPIVQIALKLVFIAIIYLVIYWLAGYYIAWQNPELRAFYGNPGPVTPFFTHTVDTFSHSPGLIFLQLFRGLLFAAIVWPVIRGSSVKPWLTALLVASLLAAPHLGHILQNPLIPLASVRFSHMVETSSSTFVFGLIIVWLLHRRHSSINDLFSI